MIGQVAAFVGDAVAVRVRLSVFKRDEPVKFAVVQFLHMHPVTVSVKNCQQLVHRATMPPNGRDKRRQKAVWIRVRMHPRRALRPDGQAEAVSSAADFDFSKLCFVFRKKGFQFAHHLRRVQLFSGQRAEGFQRIIQPNRLVAIAQFELSFLDRIDHALFQRVKHASFFPSFFP